MLKRIGLKLQIAASLAFMFLLTVAVCLIAVYSFVRIQDDFNRVDAFSVNAQDAQRIERDMLRARLALNKFLATHTNDDRANYQRAGQVMRVALETALGRLHDARSARHLETIRSDLQRFDAAFADAAGVIARLDALISKTVDVEALAMTRTVNEYTELASADYDVDGAANAGRLQEGAMMARVNIERFLRTNLNSDFEAATRAMSERVLPQLETMKQQVLDEPVRLDILERVERHAAAFRSAMNTIADLVHERDQVVHGSLVATGSKIARLTTDVARLVTAEKKNVESGLQSELERAQHMILIASGFAFALGVLLAVLAIRKIWRPLGGEPRRLEEIMLRIGAGDLEAPVLRPGEQATGVLAGMSEMHDALKRSIERERAEARSNSRLKQALDNVNANLMIADAEHRVIFANKAMSEFLDKRREKLEKHFPDFDPDKLVGTSMDVFHRDISSQRAAIEQARSTVSTELEFEDMVFIVSSDPVWSEDGERLGTAVSWRDLTAERAVEYELETIVNAAKSGDLTRRIETANKSDFHLVLSKAINELVDVSERVFADITRVFGALAEGELTQTIEADYQGVFGELKAHANATVGKLTQVIGQIKESAEQVNIGASELSQGNADLSRRTEQQGASLEETASSMEQMTGTVKRNAENAAQANELSTNTSLQAEGGGAVVDRAVAAMQEINASSQKINDIIGVIDEIAFQTNLLALNAAVEAARAGEQGRGFAVVAQEVRNLAQRSATAAKEIKALIEDSVSKVGTGSKLVDASGETLKEIVTSVKKVSEIVAEITAASQEQSIGIEQVSRAVCRMDEMTQQNAALVQEAAASSETMRNQAALMHDLVAFFATGTPVAPASSRDAPARSGRPLPAAAGDRQTPTRRSAAMRIDEIKAAV